MATLLSLIIRDMRFLFPRDFPRLHLPLVASIYLRFRAENMGMVSAALAFTTLLALVPLVTVIVSMVSALPYFDVLLGRLDGFFVDVVLPGMSGRTVAGYVMVFVQKSRKLTGMGLFLLAAASFFLLSTIERVFNHLWRAKRPRPLVRRIPLYLLVMVFGPVLMGAIAGIMSYVVTTSLGFFDEPAWVGRSALKYSSLLLLCGFFTFLYHTVPNAKVKVSDAFYGALLATGIFAVMQKGFELYVMKFATYSTVYGSFAALPIFLLWLYLSWVVIMVGALLAVTLGDPPFGREKSLASV